MDPAALINGVVTDVGSAITSVAPNALLIGAGVLALGVAYGVARKFVKKA